MPHLMATDNNLLSNTLKIASTSPKNRTTNNKVVSPHSGKEDTSQIATEPVKEK